MAVGDGSERSVYLMDRETYFERLLTREGSCDRVTTGMTYLIRNHNLMSKVAGSVKLRVFPLFIGGCFNPYVRPSDGLL